MSLGGEGMQKLHTTARRALAALLAAGLLFGLLSLSTGAANTPYFLVVNDNLPDSSVYTTPIYVNGITYVPCTVFSSQYTGVSLGVTYHWNKNDEIVSLSSATVILDFNLSTGIVSDYPGRNQYNYQPALMRNGLPYVPATQSCNFFGLRTSYLEPDGCHILRIKSGGEVLDDASYLQSARPILDSWIARYNAEQQPQPSTPDPVLPLPEAEQPGEKSNILLALQMEGGSVSGLLQSLRQRNAKAIFFFPVEQIEQNLDSMIDIINQGSRIGLIAGGGDAAAQHESIRQGAEHISLLLHQRVFFVLGDTLKDEAAAALSQEGFLLWTPRLTVKAGGRGSSQIYHAVLESLHPLKGTTRLLIADDVPAGTLSSILRQLHSEMYTLWSPSETFY